MFRTADGFPKAQRISPLREIREKQSRRRIMKKTAAGNMTNSKQTQQRIEGDFGALFVAAKGCRMKSAPHAPRPALLIFCFPTF